MYASINKSLYFILSRANEFVAVSKLPIIIIDVNTKTSICCNESTCDYDYPLKLTIT